MIKGNKKAVLIAKVSTSSGAVSKFKDKCRYIWSIIKQVWYVPFIWSLAWFSYWIFQNSIIVGLSFTQVNNFNYVGLGISIAAIIFAGYISGKSRKKKVEIAGNVGTETKTVTKSYNSSGNDFFESLPQQNFEQKMNFEKTEERKQTLESYQQVEIQRIRKHNETPLKSVQVHNSVVNNSSPSNRADQARTVQAISQECLICPNLTKCDLRQKMTAGSITSCPYAKTNPDKSVS